MLYFGFGGKFAMYSKLYHSPRLVTPFLSPPFFLRVHTKMIKNWNSNEILFLCTSKRNLPQNPHRKHQEFDQSSRYHWESYYWVIYLPFELRKQNHIHFRKKVGKCFLLKYIVHHDQGFFAGGLFSTQYYWSLFFCSLYAYWRSKKHKKDYIFLCLSRLKNSQHLCGT